MKPLPDETAGSLAFRLAQSRHQSLLSLCQQDLGLTYSQARSDLDHTLPSRHAHLLARQTGTRTSKLRSLAIPSTWLLSTWQENTRHHSGTVRLCPACLAESLHGRRFWRTYFGAACPEHGLELIEACPHCGKPIPYFGAPGGIATQFWLESWPVCPSCLLSIGISNPAHPVLIAMSRRWRSALAGRPQFGLAPERFLDFSASLIGRFSTTWRYQVAAALAVPPTHWTAHLAAAFLIKAITSRNLTQSAFYAALGTAFSPTQLSNDIMHWQQTGSLGESFTPNESANFNSLK